MTPPRVSCVSPYIFENPSGWSTELEASRSDEHAHWVSTEFGPHEWEQGRYTLEIKGDRGTVDVGTRLNHFDRLTGFVDVQCADP